MRYILLNPVALCLIISLTATGQPSPPSGYSLELKKDFNSWRWSANLNTTLNTVGKSTLDFRNQFNSDLFRESSRRNTWRDENTLNIAWQMPISSLFQVRTLLESRIFSDENNLVKFSKHLLAEELVVRVHPRIHLKPAFGAALEEAFGEQDQGWYSHLGLSISKLDMGGYLNSTDARSVIRAFPGRKNQEHTFFTAWNKQFSEYARDSLRVGYQFSESRYYIAPVSGQVPQEQVFINARFLFNQLQYRLSEYSSMAVITSFKNRDIDQRNPTLKNRRKEISLENQFQYRLTFPSFQWQLGMVFSQTDNDNPGLRTDIEALQSAFTTRLTLRPSSRNRLWAQFSYAKFEYNTPAALAEVNTQDDRDEQRFVIDAGVRHRFSRFFALTLKGNVFLYHQIYLRSGRSGNNNWNRVYQLSAQFDHTLSRHISHRNQIRILANYTVFDFDDLLPQIRSFVFRKLIYNDSLSIALTPNLTLFTMYQLEKEDNGTFFKELFAQQITKEQTAHYLTVNLQHRNIRGFQLTTGISLFRRDEWRLNVGPIAGRQKVREFRSLTPRLTLTYTAGRRLLLFLTYAPNRATDFGTVVQRFTSGNIRLQYRL